MSKLQRKLEELKFEKKKYVYDINTDIKKTYSQIFYTSKNKYSFLSKFKQKKILVIVNNSSNYIEILISTILSGNIFCPIPYFTSIQEIEKTCKYLKPKFIITDKEVILSRINSKKIIFIKNLNVAKKSFKFNNVLENSIACIYYSSGTTSDPKGVMYSHLNIFSLINSINTEFKFTNSSRHLICLPFGHTASINYSIFPSLFNKSSIFIAESFLSISDKFFIYYLYIKFLMFKLSQLLV